MRAKKTEQFPCLPCWQDLGSLVANGCEFMCHLKSPNATVVYHDVGDDCWGTSEKKEVIINYQCDFTQNVNYIHSVTQ
jgi:hypothetical protein